MGRPPPGVCSGSSVLRIASVRPRETVSPSPTPVVMAVSPGRWKGTNIRSLSAWGPRPVVVGRKG